MKPSRRQRAGFFLALGGLAAMGPVSMDMLFPALPALGRDLEIAPSAAMLTMTAFFVGLTLGQAFGPLSDVVGRRRPVLAGVVLFVVASIACASAGSIAVLAGGRLLQGTAAAAGVVLSRAIIRDLYTGVDVARHYSTLVFAVATSAVLSPTVATVILGLTSWRWVFVALGVVGAVLLLAVVLQMPESLPAGRRRSTEHGATRGAYAGLVRDRRFVGYAVTLSCGTGAITALMTGSTFVVQDEFDASTQTFASLFSVAAVAVLAVTMLNRRLLRSFSMRRLLVAGLAVSATGGLALLLVGRLSLGAYAPCFVVVVASWGLISANGTAAAVRDYGPAAGAALALIGLMQYATAALAAPLAGAAGDGTAVSVGVVVTCLSLASLGTALLTVGRERRRAAADGPEPDAGVDESRLQSLQTR